MADETRPALLASDAERERAITLLRDAAVEGRLTLEEFSDRVGRAQVARTEPDLTALTADLPAQARELALTTGGMRQTAWFSRIVRRGAWDLPASAQFRAMFGTIDLDLRQATLRADETELRIHNVFGTVSLTVPEGIAVSVEGGGAFASQVIESPGAAPLPGSPRLRIRLSGPGGTVYVRARD